jgi:hypothetical protein
MEPISILTRNGYFQRHFELCKVERSQQDAFEAVESELKKLQTEKGLPIKQRYSSYESFRKGKSLYYQNQRV